MKRTLLATLLLLGGLSFALGAISWKYPTLSTTDTPETSSLYYLYHTGRKQMLTYGAKWGTHAILDSTGVAALPYQVKSTYSGYSFYSSMAGQMGFLFRENTGTGVYTDFNYNGGASRYWDLNKNGDGTFSITTYPTDGTWGEGGYMVTNDENTYMLGWDPNAKDALNDGTLLGTNQSVYMLKPGNKSYETTWTLVDVNEYALYKAKMELYAVATTAATKGLSYTEYTAAYNGSDLDAVNAAIEALKDLMAENSEDNEPLGDLLFIALTDESTIILPQKYIEKRTDGDKFVTFELKGDTTITIAKNHIVSETADYQGELPNFLSYKFNNKFNDQLYTDAIGEIDETNGKVTVNVGCIGKRLTPSFQLPEGVKAYIKGELQHSKQTRLRFDKPVTYTLAAPKQYIYKLVKVSDEVWSVPESSDDEWLATKVNLTGDMFTTNAPSNHGEDPANMLDGDHGTMYHSTWGSGSYTPLYWYDGAYYGDGVSEWPYLEVTLPESLYRLKFEYTTRQNNNYAPLGFILQGSNNGTTWDEIQTFTEDRDGLPTTPDATYESPIINLGKSYKRLRIQLTASQRKNYLVFSEFSIYKVEENPDYKPGDPELIMPAQYAKGFYPYGKEYTVTVNFLTDKATTAYKVPRVDIWFGDNETWSSSMWIGRYGKDFYEDATIKIDGAGVFPDMDVTDVQIKGRGNSSWTNSSTSKNPYRMKFAEKVKPFGMTKGKSWVLLSNKQSGSMTTNAIAMKIADLVETRGCNHIIPVDLYINNQYRGSYNFTEKVGFSNNSIDIDDESNAVMLELDSYSEAGQFRESNYNLPVNIKEPDLDDPESGTNLSEYQIQLAFNDFTTDVQVNAGINMLDVDAFVRAMLVNDLARNEELMHPKSWFLYNEDITADSLWNFGPVWDFDWGFGYERGHNYFITAAENDLFYYMNSSNIGFPFFQRLLRGSDKVKKAYYKLWTEFIESGKLTELIEYCDDYYQYAKLSLEHNSYGDDGYLWGDGTQYATVTTNAKNWLTKRANYIYTHLDKYDISDDIIEPEEDDYGQPDRIDVAKVMSRLVNVYSINGVLVRRQVPYGNFDQGLMPGIYIVDGKKIFIGR